MRGGKAKCNMEKEHLTHCVKGAPTAAHIVTVWWLFVK